MAKSLICATRKISTLVPAPNAGTPAVPAFAQVSQSTNKKRHRGEEEEASTHWHRKVGKQPRRKQGDVRPWATGDPYVDVPRLRQWVDRGKCERWQQRYEYPSHGRMDLWQAEKQLEMDSRSTGRPIGMPLVEWQRLRALQGQVSGHQQSAIQQLQATMPVSQLQFGATQHVDSLHNQTLGFHNPNPQHVQVITPASQATFGVTQGALYLRNPSQQLNNAGFAARYPPIDPFEGVSSWFGATEGLQCRSAGFNDDLGLFPLGGSFMATAPSVGEPSTRQQSEGLRVAANVGLAVELAANTAQLQANVPAIIEGSEAGGSQHRSSSVDSLQIDDSCSQLDQGLRRVDSHLEAATGIDWEEFMNYNFDA